jgi:hypothetical protein
LRPQLSGHGYPTRKAAEERRSGGEMHWLWRCPGFSSWPIRIDHRGS